VNVKALAYPVVFALAGLLLWYAAVRGFHVPLYLLPTPLEALSEINPALLRNALVTLEEAALGFAIANLLGFLAAVLFVHCPPLEKGLFPLAIALKTTPLVALAPLLVLWCGTGLWSKVASAAMICFFPVLVNAVRGLKTIEPEEAELFATYRASRFELFRRLRLPRSLPYVMSALKISTSLAVVGAIVGEFVGANSGLGYVILLSSYHLDTPTMFAAIICAAGVGLTLFHAVGFLERRLVFWQRADEA
jgi:NitT/TauT family transport system permease protein